MRRCVAHKVFSRCAQGQGHIKVKGQIVPQIVSQQLLINYRSKFYETSQKDKVLWKGMSRTRVRSRVEGLRHNHGSDVKTSVCDKTHWREFCQTLQRVKPYYSNYSEKYHQADFIKLYRKIRHHESMCHAKNTGSYTQGQVHSQRPKVKLCPHE